MVDRDESALHAVQLSIEGRALLDSPDLVLLDIRDQPRLARLFAERRPEVVFHAAAQVDRFVNISTDKAADPCSVLGYSKRIAERLTAHVASETEGTYLSVRFGNVLGSRGSMLGTFQAQIAAGGPITVTHPEVTRYFMTVEEAVQLVIQAGAIGSDGEALVLDMGQPVAIADVARRLAELAERPVKIIYTGLRPGEKLHEILLGTDEDDIRPVHHLVSHVAVPALLGVALGWGDDEAFARFFAWKHTENPNGASPGWVALDGEQVVGFRTFVRWELEGHWRFHIDQERNRVHQSRHRCRRAPHRHSPRGGGAPSPRGGTTAERARPAVQGVLRSSVAALALVVLSPLLAAIAVAIRLSSPGPIFYCQERVARHGS